MSGIVAIVANNRLQHVTDSEIGELAAVYRSLRGTGESHAAAAGDFARLVKIQSAGGDDVGIVAEEDSWAAYTGSAYPMSLVQGSLARAIPSDLDGQFSFFRYDAGSRDFTVASDPMGMHALYRAEHEGKTYFSTSSLALAKYLRRPPNALGLQAFVLTGYHFGTLTHWEGIERVDPGTQFTFSDGEARSERYWQPEIDRSVQDMKFQQAVTHCLETSISTLRSNLGTLGPAWSDLTGGFDSRLMNVLLDAARIDFTATTRDTPTVEDIDLASRLSALANWEWVHTRLPAAWHEVLPATLPAALAWADGNLEVLQLSRVLHPHKELGLVKPNLISSGGGEHFQFYAWKSEFLRAGRSNRVNFENLIDFGMIRPTDISIFRKDPSTEVRADFLTRLKKRVEPYSEELNTAQLDLLYAYKSMGHFGAYASSDAAYLTAHLPFYFKSIFQSAFSTNFRYRNSHRLPRHMIERLSPQLAAQPTTRGGPAQPWRITNVHRFLPYYTMLGRKAVNKISHKLIGKTLLAPPPPTWEWESRATNATLDWLGRDDPFVHANMRSGPLFDGRRIDSFLTEARDPGFTNTPLLGRVITVELALRAADASL
ncbi:MAG: hypothetical protein M3285_06690 [Actinomycetota bacterium]|nr:hypothetical protein [Actinomycetota bacterium]